jgi:hypothetical protein
MAADCTVIDTSHPESAADEVIDDAGFPIDPTVNSLVIKLDTALYGE